MRYILYYKLPQMSIAKTNFIDAVKLYNKFDSCGGFLDYIFIRACDKYYYTT